MKEKIKEYFEVMGPVAGGVIALIAAFMSFLVVLVIILPIVVMIADMPKEAHKQALIEAQYQTPMDEQYVGLRWVSEGGTRVEMYFDIVKEGEPPCGVCVFDGIEYEVMLVGPFGREGMDSRNYYVLDANAEFTGDEPESFLFSGSLHWRVDKAAFYYTFDNGEEHITLLDFYPIKIPVDVFHGA